MCAESAPHSSTTGCYCGDSVHSYLGSPSCCGQQRMTPAACLLCLVFALHSSLFHSHNSHHSSFSWLCRVRNPTGVLLVLLFLGGLVAFLNQESLSAPLSLGTCGDQLRFHLSRASSDRLAPCCFSKNPILVQWARFLQRPRTQSTGVPPPLLIIFPHFD